MRVIIDECQELKEENGILNFDFNPINNKPTIILYENITNREGILLLSYINNHRNEIIEIIEQNIKDDEESLRISSDFKEMLENEIKNLSNVLINIKNNSKINIEKIIVNIESFEQLENIDALFYDFNENYPSIYVNLGSLDHEQIINALNILKPKLDKISPNLDKHIKYYGNYNYTAEIKKILDTASNREDTLFTLNTIVDIKKQVQYYNLSPYETCMLVYDMVRDREYKVSCDYMESRDINRILKGDKIVCAGYANLMSTLLNALGIKSEIILLDNEKEESGHARVLSVIKDNKYNLNHIVVSDPTLDRKKENNDFLNSYRYFARTKSYFDIDGFVWEELFAFYPQYFTNIMNSSSVESSDKLEIIKQIRKIYRLIGKENVFEKIENDPYKVYEIITNIELFKKQYKEAYFWLNQSISHESFIQCLYHVRRIEHVINPDKYPLSLDVLEKIDKESKQYKKEEILLEKIFDTTIGKMLMTTEEYNNDETIKIDIERIKVLSKLKQYYNSVN